MPETKKQKIRMSPSESATVFIVGTRRKGNDSNMWIIIETIKGVKRWKKIIRETNKTKKTKKTNKTKKIKKTN